MSATFLRVYYAERGFCRASSSSSSTPHFGAGRGRGRGRTCTWPWTARGGNLSNPNRDHGGGRNRGGPHYAVRDEVVQGGGVNFLIPITFRFLSRGFIWEDCALRLSSPFLRRTPIIPSFGLIILELISGLRIHGLGFLPSLPLGFISLGLQDRKPNRIL